MIPGRTNTTAVSKLLLADLDPSVTDLSPWIDYANEIVTTVVAVDPAYTAYQLELIERALSAHFYCITDPRTKSEGVSGVSASYEGNTSMYLEQTRFGQMAMVMDYNGWLSTMSKLMSEGKRRRKLGVIWLGGGNTGADTGYQPFPSPQLDQILQGGDLTGGDEG